MSNGNHQSAAETYGREHYDRKTYRRAHAARGHRAGVKNKATK